MWLDRFSHIWLLDLIFHWQARNIQFLGDASVLNQEESFFCLHTPG